MAGCGERMGILSSIRAFWRTRRNDPAGRSDLQIATSPGGGRSDLQIATSPGGGGSDLQIATKGRSHVGEARSGDRSYGEQESRSGDRSYAEDTIRQADRLSASNQPEAAYELRIAAIAELEDEDHPNAGGPWRHAELVRQKYAAARDADRVATLLADRDDAAAIRWWRNASHQLGSLNTLAHDLAVEVDFLQQKVLGEGAAAHHRVAQTANDALDARGAIQAWMQASRLLGHLMQRYQGQPAWVEEMHQVVLTSAGALCHQLAREAAAESPVSAQDWQTAADLFTQLLDRHPEVPHWVPKLHESALRNGAVACRNLATDHRDSDPERAAALRMKSVHLMHLLVTRYPDQPAWVPHYRASLLAEAGREAFDLAQQVADAEPADVERQRHLWRQAALLLGQLIRLDPDQSAWALHSLEVARSHAKAG
jgi:hypothetical protein